MVAAECRSGPTSETAGEAVRRDRLGQPTAFEPSRSGGFDDQLTGSRGEPCAQTELALRAS